MWFMGRVALLLVVGPFFVAIWLASAAANFAHAMFLAGDSEWAWVIGSASAASDVLKAAMAMAVAIALRERLWTALAAALLVWCATTAWSMRSGIGFIAVQMADSTSGRKSDVVDTTTRLQQLETEVGSLDWLQKQVIETRYHKERERLAEEIEKTRESIRALREQSKGAKPIMTADPSHEVFQTLGIAGYINSATTVLIFLAVLELASNLGPLALSAFFRRPSVNNVPDPDPGKRELLQQPIRLPRKARPKMQHVTAWAQDAVRRLGPRYTFRTASDLYQDYVAFCERLGIEPYCQSPIFYDAVHEHCVRRRNGNRRTYTLPDAVPGRAHLQLAS